MSLVYHVYRPGPGKSYGNRISPDSRIAYYGQAITAQSCSNAIIHEPPRDATDQRWLDAVLSTRLVPGATITNAWEADHA